MIKHSIRHIYASASKSQAASHMQSFCLDESSKRGGENKNI